jgi:hypothetical protein
MPPDTIGKFIAPLLRHLMLVDGLSVEQALATLALFLSLIPEKSFSDRLTHDPAELMRVAT